MVEELEALTDIGLVEKIEEAHGYIKGTWDLTNEGRKHFKDGMGFCYGKPVVKSIISSFEAAKNTFVVKYDMSLVYEPSWGKDLLIRIDTYGKPRAGENTTTLILTDKGWVHESMF